MKRLILLIILVCLLLCGCKHMKAKEIDHLDDGRFELEYNQSGSFRHILILKDSDTGTLYMFVRDGYAGGLTKLE